MTINLIPLDYNGIELRMVGEIDKPEWVAADVVAILYPDSDPQNRSSYVRAIPEEWKGSAVVTCDLRNSQVGVRNTQTMVTLFEPGLYSLLMKSRSEIAVHFQKWLFEEVLPSIRRTGGYSVNPEPDEFAELDARIKRAIELSGKPGEHAVAAYRALFGTALQQSTKAKVKPVPTQIETSSIPTSADIVKDFLAKLDILTEKGLVGEWNVTHVKRKLMPCTAVHLSAVWPVVIRYANPTYDRATLHQAILAYGGEVSATQKFLPKAGGIKKTIQHRCVLIPSATSATRRHLESTLLIDM